MKGAVASIIANAVWNKSKDIRECLRILPKNPVGNSQSIAD